MPYINNTFVHVVCQHIFTAFDVFYLIGFIDDNFYDSFDRDKKAIRQVCGPAQAQPDDRPGGVLALALALGWSLSRAVV